MFGKLLLGIEMTMTMGVIICVADRKMHNGDGIDQGSYCSETNTSYKYE